jgi:hypothetical protein
MNTQPTPRAPAHDADLIHTSTRSCITTNASPAPGAPPRVTLRTTRLEIRWIDGDVSLRFSAQAIDVTPRPRGGQRRYGR